MRCVRPCEGFSPFGIFTVQPLYKAYASYGTVGLEFVLSVLLGLFGGRWLDRTTGVHGIFTLLGFLFGSIAGFRAIWRAAQRAQKEAEQMNMAPTDGPPSPLKKANSPSPKEGSDPRPPL